MGQQQFNSCMRYQSDYANEVHQLAVSVSKHLLVLKNGRLTYQRKPVEINLAKLAGSSKQHAVHYLIRDHYSGVFYAEMCSSVVLTPVEEFLFRAWSRKEHYTFCGLPDYLSIPETVRDMYPSIDKLIRDYEIHPVRVTSGFQSGAIRDLKTWESHIDVQLRCEASLQLMRAWTPTMTTAISSDLNGEYAGTQAKIYKWDYGVRDPIRLPPEAGWYNES